MKKILMAALMSMAVTVHAQTAVPLIWPFSLASWQGAMAREIVQEANSQQTKFNFVLENRPGAGGAVATNHVLSSKTPAILANSDSFFTRPAMFAEGSYDVNAFVPLVMYCRDQPIALISKNVASIQNLSGSRNFTIGINPGSITQLVSNELVRQRSTIAFTEVFFKSTPEVTVAVLGDHVDLSIDFLNNVQDPRLKPLAITGTRNVGTHRTFQSQGIAGFENLSVSYYLLIPRSLDPGLANELGAILARAAQGARVQEACSRDHGQPVSITGAAAQKIFNDRRDFFAGVVKNLPKK